MKTRTMSSILGLVAVTGLAAWLNYNPDRSQEMDLQANSPRSSAEYLLAVSWHPAFCEMRPSKPECRTAQTAPNAARGLVLHGLWPKSTTRNYCGVPQHLIDLDKRGRWKELPELDLSRGLRDRLQKAMPGYRSYLHRHEWFKHGTCMPGYTPEEYFLISLNLLEDLKGSEFAKWMQNSIGERLNYRDIDRVFSRSFGSRAADKLVIDCYRDDGRRIISELKIALSGKLDRLSVLDELISNASDQGSSCPSGIVDRHGQQ